jgi:hypothetical protein
MPITAKINTIGSLMAIINPAIGLYNIQLFFIRANRRVSRRTNLQDYLYRLHQRLLKAELVQADDLSP